MPKCVEMVHHKKTAGQPTCRCHNEALPGKDVCAAHDSDRLKTRAQKSNERYARLSRLDRAVRARQMALEVCARAVLAWAEQEGSLSWRTSLRDATSMLCAAEVEIKEARLAIMSAVDRVPVHQLRLMTNPVLIRP